MLFLLIYIICCVISYHWICRIFEYDLQPIDKDDRWIAGILSLGGPLSLISVWIVWVVVRLGWGE